MLVLYRGIESINVCISWSVGPFCFSSAELMKLIKVLKKSFFFLLICSFFPGSLERLSQFCNLSKCEAHPEFE